MNEWMWHRHGNAKTAYRKSSNRSREFDLIVLSEAGHQIQPGFQEFAQPMSLLSERLLSETHGYRGLS